MVVVGEGVTGGGQAAGWYGIVGKRLREIEGLGVEMLAGGGRRD